MTCPPGPPKPRPYYEEGKPLWFRRRRDPDFPGLSAHMIDSEAFGEFYEKKAGDWIGPFALPWEEPPLPPEHDWPALRRLAAHYAECVVSPTRDFAAALLSLLPPEPTDAPS